jgi:Transposase DDE domain group 1
MNVLVCLLKNSYSRNLKKLHRVRMPYKRLSRLGWTFSMPQSGVVFPRKGLFQQPRLSALIVKNIMDARRGKNTQLPLPDLLRQSIYSRLAGYEDLNDAERLSQDPTLRLIGFEKIWERGAALPSRLDWFETEVLSQSENLDGLSRINRELLAKAETIDSLHRVVLDMDSTEIPVYGEQEHPVCPLSLIDPEYDRNRP